jgi:hypothetical protein
MTGSFIRVRTSPLSGCRVLSGSIDAHSLALTLDRIKAISSDCATMGGRIFWRLNSLSSIALTSQRVEAWPLATAESLPGIRPVPCAVHNLPNAQADEKQSTEEENWPSHTCRERSHRL